MTSEAEVGKKKKVKKVNESSGVRRENSHVARWGWRWDGGWVEGSS